MKIVTINSQKGGVGKSTTAFCLAIAAYLDGKSSCILDLDPQSTSMNLRDRRQAEEPAVQTATATRLKKFLEVAEKEKAELVIIDTAPKNATEALTAMEVSNLVIIPTTDSIGDLEAMQPTVDTAKLAKTPAYIYFCRIKPRSAMLASAQKAVGKYNIPLVPIVSHDRVIYSTAAITGQTPQEIEPEGKAAQEISELYQWLKTVINL